MEQWDVTSKHLRARLEEATRDVGVSLTPEALDLALEHARLLLEWNQKTNLTRITEPEELARRHFAESFLAATLLPAATLDILDVGSGAGFPGLAIRLVRPSLRLTLLEPRAPKAAFLSVVAALHPPPVPRVLPRRLEDLDARARWDAISLRALRPDFRLLAGHLVPGGVVLLFEGPHGGHSPEAVREGFQVEDVRTVRPGVGDIVLLRLAP